MKNNSLLSAFALGFIAVSAQAETFQCSFTEPFFWTKYDTKKKTLTVASAEYPTPSVMKNVTMKETKTGTFELRDRKGELLQRLVFTGEGSDGMSDIVFPYEAAWYMLGEKQSPLIGGCESKAHPSTHPEPESVSTSLIDEGDDIRLHTSTETD